MRLVILALVIAVAVEAYAPQYTGDNWENLPAATKVATLYGRCMDNPNNNGWYTIGMTQLFLEDMDLTFDSYSDDMPAQLFVQERPKLIHSVGVAAEIAWTNVPGHPYTGGFRGAKNGILRLSLAAKPDGKGGPVTPGFGLKLLRTGVPSANLMAMYSLQGQSSYNFYEHDFTNHPGDQNIATMGFVLRQLYETFKKGSDWPTIIGLSDFAKYDEDGALEATPVFPWRLIFHPTAAVHTHMSSATSTDANYFLPLLQDKFYETRLYEVYAHATPQDELNGLAPKLIGYLDVKSPFTSSNYGDKDLFFRHTRFEDDLLQQPGWLPAVNTLLAEQRASTAPGGYVYKDLPWTSDVQEAATA